MPSTVLARFGFTDAILPAIFNGRYSIGYRRFHARARQQKWLRGHEQPVRITAIDKMRTERNFFLLQHASCPANEERHLRHYVRSIIGKALLLRSTYRDIVGSRCAIPGGCGNFEKLLQESYDGGSS